MPSFPSSVVIREVGLRDGLQSIATHSADRAQDRMDPRRLRRRSARDRGRLVRAGATAAATGRHRRTGRLREDAAGPVRLGAGAEPARAPSARSNRGADLMLRAAVGEPRAQPRQPAQDARRGGRRSRAHSRGARRRRLEDADRRRHRHRVRLHDPGPRRAGRSAALHAGAARRRRRSRRASPTRSATPIPRMVRDLFEQALRDRRRPLLVRPLPRHARPRPRQRLRGARSRRRALRRVRSPASAAVRMRRARAATRRPRTSRSCSPAWASRPASTFDRAARAARQGRRLARRRNAARHAVARRFAEDLRRSRRPTRRRLRSP